MWGVVIFVFLFLPIVWIVFVLVQHRTAYLTVWNGFGFEGYQAFFDNPTPRAAVKVSLIVAVLSALVGNGPGLVRRGRTCQTPGKVDDRFLCVRGACAGDT